MNYVAEILKNEKEKLLALKKSYEDMVVGMPKGSIQKKERKNNVYFYLAYRDGKSVKTEYIGDNEAEIIKIKEQLERRKQIKELISKLNSELKIIDKTLGGAK